jgi:hypothetical protein
MTSYVAIPNGDIDQDSPITQPLMTALRDNPIAITEAAPGAPRIVGDAMFGPSAGTVVQRNCLPTGNRSVTTPNGTTNTLLIEYSFVTALVPCTIQYLVTFTGNGLNVFKNGTSVQNYTTSQTNATVSVTLAAGDSAGISIRATGSGPPDPVSATTTLTTCQIRVDTRSAVMT